MDSKQSDARQLNIKYVFEHDYNPSYVNGAYGSITPAREIVVNFYHERPPVPNKSDLFINDGRVVDEKFDTSSVDYIRYIQSGIILTYKSAKSIHQWLGGLLDKMEGEQDGVHDS